MREHPDLGILTSYFGAMSDIPIVERSWGLIGNGKVYGPNFRFSEYARTKSLLLAVFIHLVMTLGSMLLKLPFATWAMRKVIPPRGYGASEEETKSHFAEYRAVGRPNADTMTRAHARVRYEGGLYECEHSSPAALVLYIRRMMAIFLMGALLTFITVSGLLVSQAALTLLKDDVTVKKLGGGFMTPATLGQPLIDRLADLGFKIEVKMVE